MGKLSFLNYIFSLYPKEPQARAQVDFLLNWDLGDLYASIMKSLYPTLGFRPMPADLEAEKKNYQAKLQFMNDHLIKVSFRLKIFMNLVNHPNQRFLNEFQGKIFDWRQHDHR